MEMQLVRAVIVGAGASTSTPSLSCILSGTPCQNCTDALTYCSGHNHHSGHDNGAYVSKIRNHRLNPCFLLQLRHPYDSTIHNVLIDCGKTFRESAIKVFPTFGVSNLSAVLLTHDHADAAFGIDDLREFNRRDTALDVYADERTLRSMQSVYPYLFPRDGPAEVGAWRKNNTGFIAAIQWKSFAPLGKLTLNISPRAGHVIDGDLVSNPTGATITPMNTNDDSNPTSVAYSVVPIPVRHGPNYYSNAFLIPMYTANEPPRLLLYVSDISVVDVKFFNDVAHAKTLLGLAVSSPIEVLLLDMLSHNLYFAHLSVGASIKAAQQINATKTFFIGMSHSLNYSALTQHLKELGLSDKMAIGFDGCVVAVGADDDGGELHHNL